MKELLALGPNISRLVPDVKFRMNVRGTKVKTARRLVVVSTHGLDAKLFARVRDAYLSDLGRGYVSFPIRERSEHLYTRLGEHIYNFGHWGRFFGRWLAHFRKRKFRVPRRRALEVVLRLEEREMERLELYVRNILRGRRKVLGHFDQEGTQATRSLPSNNLPLSGGHNCSSWIATAPLGENNEPLLELLGGDRALNIGTNPGWFTNWLAATAPAERLPFVILWTSLPIDEALGTEVFPERNLPWDFYRQ
jgi:hypothetical protein